MKHHELHRLYTVQKALLASSRRSRPPSSGGPSQNLELQRRRITAQGSIASMRFYAFISALARRWDLIGFVLKTSTSTRVLIEVQGHESAIENFLDALLTKAPPLARIDAINTELLPPSSEENSFEIQ